jgi:CRISPR/Cas system-associated endonuclease Cas1
MGGAEMPVSPQPLMQTLLLSKPGTGLRVSDRELLIVESGKVSARYRPYRTGFDQVLIEENGAFDTFSALRWLSAQGISFAGVRYNGILDFATVPSAPTSGPVKVAQARVAASPPRSLAVAQALVRARNAAEAAAAEGMRWSIERWPNAKSAPSEFGNMSSFGRLGCGEFVRQSDRRKRLSTESSRPLRSNAMVLGPLPPDHGPGGETARFGVR